MNPEQSEDGIPHMAYYRRDHHLSFVWDGNEPFVEVCHGGYGEPVVDNFPINPNTHAEAKQLLFYFRRRCDDFVRNYWEKSTRCQFMQQEIRAEAKELIDSMTDEQIKAFLEINKEMR